MRIIGGLRFQILLPQPMLVTFHFAHIIDFVNHLLMADFGLVPPHFFFFFFYFPIYFLIKIVEEGRAGGF